MAKNWLSFDPADPHGEGTNFEELYNSLKGSLYYYINNRIKNQHDAEEITVDIFMKMLPKMSQGQFKSLAHLKNWLYLKAKTTCINHLAKEYTKEKNLPTLDLQPDLDDIADPDLQSDILEAETQWQYRLDSIWQTISTLGERQQTALRLRYQEGKSISEIAASMSTREDTVKKYIKLGLRTIKEDPLIKTLMLLLIILCIQFQIG